MGQPAPPPTPTRGRIVTISLGNVGNPHGFASSIVRGADTNAGSIRDAGTPAANLVWVLSGTGSILSGGGLRLGFPTDTADSAFPLRVTLTSGAFSATSVSRSAFTTRGAGKQADYSFGSGFPADSIFASTFPIGGTVTVTLHFDQLPAATLGTWTATATGSSTITVVANINNARPSTQVYARYQAQGESGWTAFPNSGATPTFAVDTGGVVRLSKSGLVNGTTYNVQATLDVSFVSREQKTVTLTGTFSYATFAITIGRDTDFGITATGYNNPRSLGTIDNRNWTAPGNKAQLVREITWQTNTPALRFQNDNPVAGNRLVADEYPDRIRMTIGDAEIIFTKRPNGFGTFSTNRSYHDYNRTSGAAITALTGASSGTAATVELFYD